MILYSMLSSLMLRFYYYKYCTVGVFAILGLDVCHCWWHTSSVCHQRATYSSVSGVCANVVVLKFWYCMYANTVFRFVLVLPLLLLLLLCLWSYDLVLVVVVLCVVVLAVLVSARRHFGSHVNTLIANQSAMDLFACIFLVIGFGMMLPGTPRYDFGLGQVGNALVCFLFQSRVLAVVCKTAGNIGLAQWSTLTVDGHWQEAEKS